MTKRYGNVEAANTHVISMNTDAWSTNLKLAECKGVSRRNLLRQSVNSIKQSNLLEQTDFFPMRLYAIFI